MCIRFVSGFCEIYEPFLNEYVKISDVEWPPLCTITRELLRINIELYYNISQGDVRPPGRKQTGIIYFCVIPGCSRLTPPRGQNNNAN